MRLPGLYVPLYVDYVRDDDIRRAGPEAELLYIRGLAYSKACPTPGEIPDFDLPVIAVGLTRVPARVAALVTHDLWQPKLAGGGWLIRNWDKWNEPTEAIEAKRRVVADRQARKRARDKAAEDARIASVTRDVTRDVTPENVTVTQLRARVNQSGR